MAAVSNPEHRATVAGEVQLVPVASGKCCFFSGLEFSEHQPRDGGMLREDHRRDVHGLMEPLPHHFEVVDFDGPHLSLHPVDHASDGRSGSAPAKAIPPPGRVLLAVSQRSVGPCRGGSRPGRIGGDVPAGRGVLRRLIGLPARINDSLIGDAIGVACLFALLWGGLLLGAALEGM